MQLQALGANVQLNFNDGVTDVITDKMLTEEVKIRIINEMKIKREQHQRALQSQNSYNVGSVDPFNQYTNRSLNFLRTSNSSNSFSSTQQISTLDTSATSPNITVNSSERMDEMDELVLVRLAYFCGKMIYHITKFGPWLDRHCPRKAEPMTTFIPNLPPIIQNTTTPSFYHPSYISSQNNTGESVIDSCYQPHTPVFPNSTSIPIFNEQIIQPQVSHITQNRATQPQRTILPNRTSSTQSSLQRNVTYRNLLPSGHVYVQNTQIPSNTEDSRRVLVANPPVMLFLSVIDGLGIFKPLHKEFGVDEYGISTVPRLNLNAPKGCSPFMHTAPQSSYRSQHAHNRTQQANIPQYPHYQSNQIHHQQQYQQPSQIPHYQPPNQIQHQQFQQFQNHMSSHFANPPEIRSVCNQTPTHFFMASTTQVNDSTSKKRKRESVQVTQKSVHEIIEVEDDNEDVEEDIGHTGEVLPNAHLRTSESALPFFNLAVMTENVLLAPHHQKPLKIAQLTESNQPTEFLGGLVAPVHQVQLSV